MTRTQDMIRADAEIERDFSLTRAEIAESRERDKAADDCFLTTREAKRKAYNKAYNKRYYSRNKAAILAKNKAYRDAHIDRERERSAKWRQNNAEYEQTYQHAYYGENRALILAKKQAAYAVEKAYRQIVSEA